MSRYPHPQILSQRMWEAPSVATAGVLAVLWEQGMVGHGFDRTEERVVVVRHQEVYYQNCLQDAVTV